MAELNLKEIIERDGIDVASAMLGFMINDKIPNREVAWQFVLEEIEAASRGNDTAMSFAKNSGISPQQYKGAMANSWSEVDGPDGPQQFLLWLCTQLQPDVDLVVELRTKIVDNIMKYYEFGKYEDE